MTLRLRTIRRPTAALLLPVLLLCLRCCACRASSPNAAVDGPPRGPIDDPGAGASDGTDDEKNNNDAIDSVAAQLSSWMKEKHKYNAKSRKKGAGGDASPQSLQQRPSSRELPFVTLAWAQTLDGMIAARRPPPRSRREAACASYTSNMRLSGPESAILTHRLRSMHDAVLVGGSTFLLDAPRLNVRLPSSLPASATFGSGSPNNALLEQPVPVVLDTHLNHLQRLLFDKIVTSQSTDEGPLPDISVDEINARNPVICCSPNATQWFLDTLEVFRDEQAAKRKPSKSYKIAVYKKIDDEGDHEQDFLLPIKITIRVVTHHGKKQEEDTLQEVTLTLLPCPIDGAGADPHRLDVRRTLRQLRDQLGIESVMVEGGAGILSSFLNDGVDDENGVSEGGEGGGGNRRRYGKAADCICATIVPRVIGGKWGLPVFRKLDVLHCHRKDRTAGESGDEINGDEGDGAFPMMLARDGRFVSLGPDCIFLGRI